MKMTMKLLTAALGLAFVGGTAVAESQYGHSATGAGQVSASADLNVVVNVPKLILLRVGTSGGTADTATLDGAFAGIPGGVAGPLAAGTNSSGWDDTVPVLNDASSSAVSVRAWTNSSGGGALAASVVTAFAEAGLGAKVTVAASAPAAGGALPHPTASLASAATTTPFVKNAVVGSDWTFNITGTDLATLPAGTHTQLMRYTATSL